MSCYRQYNGTIGSISGFTACSNFKSSSGFSPCCASGHVCLEDGFCHNPTSEQGQSGYYMGLCTDPSYKDSSCPQYCTDLYKGDVVYSTTTSLWSCCGQTNNTDPNSAVSCNNPTSETFQDLSPQQLLAASTSTSMTSTSTSTSSSSSTASSTSTKTSATSSASASASSTPGAKSGLSTGATAGIGIGAALVVLALIGLIFYLMRARKTRRKSYAAVSAVPQSYPADKVEMASPGAPQEIDSAPKYSQYSSPQEKYSEPVSTFPIQEMGDENRR